MYTDTWENKLAMGRAMSMTRTVKSNRTEINDPYYTLVFPTENHDPEIILVHEISDKQIAITIYVLLY